MCIWIFSKIGPGPFLTQKIRHDVKVYWLWFFSVLKESQEIYPPAKFDVLSMFESKVTARQNLGVETDRHLDFFLDLENFRQFFSVSSSCTHDKECTTRNDGSWCAMSMKLCSDLHLIRNIFFSKFRRLMTSSNSDMSENQNCSLWVWWRHFQTSKLCTRYYYINVLVCAKFSCRSYFASRVMLNQWSRACGLGQWKLPVWPRLPCCQGAMNAKFGTCVYNDKNDLLTKFCMIMTSSRDVIVQKLQSSRSAWWRHSWVSKFCTRYIQSMVCVCTKFHYSIYLWSEVMAQNGPAVGEKIAVRQSRTGLFDTRHGNEVPGVVWIPNLAHRCICTI